jgi:hypothetical protein
MLGYFENETFVTYCNLDFEGVEDLGEFLIELDIYYCSNYLGYSSCASDAFESSRAAECAGSSCWLS